MQQEGPSIPESRRFCNSTKKVPTINKIQASSLWARWHKRCRMRITIHSPRKREVHNDPSRSGWCIPQFNKNFILGSKNSKVKEQNWEEYGTRVQMLLSLVSMSNGQKTIRINQSSLKRTLIIPGNPQPVGSKPLFNFLSTVPPWGYFSFPF